MQTSEATRHRPMPRAGFIAGVTAVFSGLRLILGDPELRKLTVIPVLLTGLLYAGFVVGLVAYGDDLLGWLWAPPESTWLLWLWRLAWFAGMLTLFLIAALLFSTVGEVVGGPFYEQMAIRILTRHGITVAPAGFVDGTVLDVFRSLLFVLPAAFFAILALIPGVGLPFAVLAGGLAWLGFGSGAINPALLVTGYRFGARLSYVRQHFMTILGLGSVVAMSLAVPLLPLLSIPCSIAGATDLYGRRYH